MATVNGFNAFNHSWDFYGKTHSNKFRRFGIHEKEKYGWKFMLSWNEKKDSDIA